MFVFVILIILFVVGFGVYNMVILPKMNEKADKKQQSLKDSFIAQVNGREDELRSQYVTSNGFVSFIAKQMNAEAVEGIISCMERRDMKDVARQALTNVAGKAVGKLVGIGFKQVDNEEYYYLALTPDQLHYLHFSESGNCKEHLSFDRNRMENLESGKVTAAESVAVQGDMFSSLRLSFTYDGTLYKFFYLDRFYLHPSGGKVANEEQMYAELNYLYAEPFLKFAGSVRREA